MAAATTSLPPNEPSPLPSEKATANLLPGTTIPDPLPPKTLKHLTTTETPSPLSETPISTPGPLINARPTTLTLYSPPSQLQNAACIPSMVQMINATFSAAHEASKTFPAELDRLGGGAEQYRSELGQDPGTFTYVLTYRDSDDSTVSSNSGGKSGGAVLATCAGMRFYGHATAVIKQADGSDKASSFRRIGFPDAGTEVWEVRHLAVDVSAQKQGLAGWLLGLVEEEVRRRFLERRKRVAGNEEEEEEKVEKLVMFLTTMKETNEGFYSKRGYAMDQEVKYPAGHMDSRSPFSVLHMSKVLEGGEKSETRKAPSNT